MKALEKQLRNLRRAASILSTSSDEARSETLVTAANLLLGHSQNILKANAQDLKALDKKTTPAFRDRLTLNLERIEHMAESLRQVAQLENPLNEEVERRSLENGLLVRKVRAPLGVILMIFESRPNVAIEAFSLAFKSGNVIALRGGKESMNSTKALYEVLNLALDSNSLPRDCLWGITNPDRKITNYLLKQKKWIDIVVPRGGDKLIEFVVKNSQIPIIKNDRGLCHVYIHEDADQKMGIDIAVNAKVQRPGVCNSMETLLVHDKVAKQVIPAIYEAMSSYHVKWFGCSETMKILKGKKDVKAAKSESWDTEYLDLKMNCKVVNSLEDTLAHIAEHGSRHSESIITRNADVARKFQAKIDAAVVYWNASTRFTDGFELGLGGELGISTQKLHVRGPVGLKELTNVRWIIDGDGQVR